MSHKNSACLCDILYHATQFFLSLSYFFCHATYQSTNVVPFQGPSFNVHPFSSGLLQLTNEILAFDLDCTQLNIMK